MKDLPKIFENWFNNENAKEQDSLYNEIISADEESIDAPSDVLISILGDCGSSPNMWECKSLH